MIQKCNPVTDEVCKQLHSPCPLWLMEICIFSWKAQPCLSSSYSSLWEFYSLFTGEGLVHCLYAGDINLSLYWSLGFCFISFTTIIQRLYRAGKALCTLSVWLFILSYLQGKQYDTVAMYTTRQAWVWIQSLLFTIHVGIQAPSPFFVSFSFFFH